MTHVLKTAGSVVVLSALAALGMGASKPDATQVTFSRDVAPILNQRCAECHRPGEIAPMSLMTYKDARPWARAIRERVLDRSMPPWSADPHYGKFDNDPTLSQKEIDTIVGWVNGGAVQGDEKDLPPAPKFAEGWTIGKPDVVLTMAEEFQVPAEGTIPYKYFTVPTNLSEDKWVQAFEIRPSNRSVVHHVIASIQEPGTRAANPEATGQGRGRSSLGGITPNKTGMVFPDGTARLLRAGSSIVLQMHYTTNGEPASDRTSVGLVFAKETPKRVLGGGNTLNARFAIPPGDPNYEIRASTTFNEDTYLLSMMPHMHVRGKDFTYTAVYPDGKSETILSVPKYDFNWQHTYRLKEPLLLPKGSRLDCVAHYDNSTQNKYNPDPSKEVRWGDQTWEEMMIGWFTTVRDFEPATKPVTAASER